MGRDPTILPNTYSKPTLHKVTLFPLRAWKSAGMCLFLGQFPFVPAFLGKVSLSYRRNHRLPLFSNLSQNLRAAFQGLVFCRK